MGKAGMGALNADTRHIQEIKGTRNDRKEII